MNRVHIKYDSIGFAIIEMNAESYHLATREDYFKAINVIGFEHTDNLGPNDSIVRNISYNDTTILYKLIDYISAVDESEILRNSIRKVTLEEVKASEEAEIIIRDAINNLISESTVSKTKSFEYNPKPEKRKEVFAPENSVSVSSYPRDAQKRINALIRADFTCEMNPEHNSFISRKTNKPYMETHHLIPLEYWESFKNNLDVEANIVCLCSNCHNEIHYGKYSVKLIKPLYEKRKDELQSAGIEIDVDSLIEMYEGDFIKKENKRVDETS